MYKTVGVCIKKILTCIHEGGCAAQLGLEEGTSDMKDKQYGLLYPFQKGGESAPTWMDHFTKGGMKMTCKQGVCDGPVVEEDGFVSDWYSYVAFQTDLMDWRDLPRFFPCRGRVLVLRSAVVGNNHHFRAVIQTPGKNVMVYEGISQPKRKDWKWSGSRYVFLEPDRAEALLKEGNYKATIAFYEPLNTEDSMKMYGNKYLDWSKVFHARGVYTIPKRYQQDSDESSADSDLFVYQMKRQGGEDEEADELLFKTGCLGTSAKKSKDRAPFKGKSVDLTGDSENAKTNTDPKPSEESQKKQKMIESYLQSRSTKSNELMCKEIQDYVRDKTPANPRSKKKKYIDAAEIQHEVTESQKKQKIANNGSEQAVNSKEKSTNMTQKEASCSVAKKVQPKKTEQLVAKGKTKTCKNEAQWGWSVRSPNRQRKGPLPRCAGCRNKIPHDRKLVFLHRYMENDKLKYGRVDQWCGKVACMKYVQEGQHRTRFLRKGFGIQKSETIPKLQRKLKEIWRRESFARNNPDQDISDIEVSDVDSDLTTTE